jgi:hypothetical protein
MVAMKTLAEEPHGTGSTGLALRNHHEETNYGITGVKSGTVLLKRDSVHVNIISNMKRDKFINQQTGKCQM